MIFLTFPFHIIKNSPLDVNVPRIAQQLLGFSNDYSVTY